MTTLRIRRSGTRHSLGRWYQAGDSDPRPINGSETMDPAAEFRRHAEECRRMARTTANLEDRTTWNQLAARWLACADQFEKQPRQARPGASRRNITGPRNAA